MLPIVILHIGCSLDARIDWLKPDNFIYYRVIQSWKVDAMISGSHTILAAEMSDDPNITKLSDQYLVVVDSKGRINNWEIIKRQAYWNDTPIVLCSQDTPIAYLDRLNDLQIHSLIHGVGHVNLAPALEDLHELFGIEVLRIDSGGILAGVMLREKLVDEVSIVYSPQLTGGQSPKSIFVAPDLTSISDVIDLRLLEHQVIDDNYVHLRYKVI